MYPLRFQGSDGTAQLFVVLSLLGAAGTAGAAADLQRRFYEEAPRQWEAHQAFGRRLQIASKGTRTYDGGKDEYSAQVKRRTDASLTVRRSAPAGAAEVVSAHGINPLYSFKLKRTQRGWLLEELKLHSDSPKNSEEYDGGEVMHYRSIGLMLYDLWLPSLLKDPDFKVKSVQPHSSEDEQWARVDFEYHKETKAYPVRGSLQITRGWMALDPAHDWILREYAVNYKAIDTIDDNNLIQAQLKIKEGTDRHAIVVNFQRRTSARAKDGRMHETTQEVHLEVVENPDVPMSEFTLSAFGLPEPYEVAEASKNATKTPMYVWLLIAAGACGAFALAFAWLRKRRAA